MPPKGLKNIAITEELYDKLKARKRPHQGFSGVIEELLDIAQKQEVNNGRD